MKIKKQMLKESQNRPLSTGAIIHLFALGHAAVAIASRAMDYYDDLPLTLLTVAMMVIISIRHRLQVQLAAILTVVACFLGFLVGGYCGMALRIVIHSDLWAPAITTFAVTEILGWITYLIARSRGSHELQTYAGNTTRYILLAAVFILIIRVGYILIIRELFGNQENIYPELEKFFSNTFAILLMVCSSTIMVHLYITNRHRIYKQWHHLLWICLSILLVATGTSLFLLYGFSQTGAYRAGSNAFTALFLSMLLISIVSYALLYLGYHALLIHRELNDERVRHHLARWQYNRFKQQINPHFLFNSLNILDILVQEGEQERASRFVRKLAGLYRYMLRNEEEQLVTLREEMEFTSMYIDLIQERFTDGLKIENRIPDEALLYELPPCAVQQLIENATKHNIVSNERPLKISIWIEDEQLIVENNLQLRLSRRHSSSTHLGLKCLNQQYQDIARREIRILQDEARFRVELPLIKTMKR